MTTELEGVIPIAATPFDAAGRVQGAGRWRPCESLPPEAPPSGAGGR